MSEKIIAVPDLGTSEPVDVIEVLVKEGDPIEKEQIIAVLETEKASVEVPSEEAGTVVTVHAKVGSKLVTGEPLVTLSVAAAPEMGSAAKAAGSTQADPASASETTTATSVAASAREPVRSTRSTSQAAAASGAATALRDLVVPDVGGGELELIELPLVVGKPIAADDIVAVLESDKSTVEIPADFAGVVEQCVATVGQKLKQGDVLARVRVSGESAAEKAAAEESVAPTPRAASEPIAAASAPVVTAPASPARGVMAAGSTAAVYAGPAVRKLARDMGVDLAQVRGSGPKGRIIKDDLYAQVKTLLTEKPAVPAGAAFAMELPVIDFAQFGPVDTQPMSKLRKTSARNLHRSWVTIPHVTQFDEADITELESFRKVMNAEIKDSGVKLTPLAFLLKACAHVLADFPNFRSALSVDGEMLHVRNYYHIGVAVDTPNGLVVPVIRDVDRKGIRELAAELGVVSAKARERKLLPGDMQGAVFSISSLGGIGGTAFTPIVNWPEVAILGVSKSRMAPVYDGSAFVPRLMLPLSLSYDHRVIDGADGARFTSALSAVLGDIRRLSL